MKTKEEIQERKDQDIQFIISAVTSELENTAYLKYFDAWENNGGMGWFFTECVEITHKIMLTEGSQYLKWLDYWTNTEEEHPQFFSEFTGETCFDWYHMNEAMKEFKSRYEEDECTKEQVSECIGHLINGFKTEVDRDEVMNMALKYAKKGRERKENREKLAKEKREEEERKKKAAYDKIINDLKELDVDGENMQNILEAVGMEDQMHRQLIVSYATAESTEALLEELKELQGK
jgi:hypothetical protein